MENKFGRIECNLHVDLNGSIFHREGAKMQRFAENIFDVARENLSETLPPCPSVLSCIFICADPSFLNISLPV
jgi:hypothetical protein